MRVKFLKDWQGESSASFKKGDIKELPDTIAWDLAAQGFVKFLGQEKDPEVEKAKKRFRIIHVR